MTFAGSCVAYSNLDSSMLANPLTCFYEVATNDIILTVKRTGN